MGHNNEYYDMKANPLNQIYLRQSNGMLTSINNQLVI